MYAGIEAGGTKFVVAVGTGPDDLSGLSRFRTTTPRETLARAVETVRNVREGADPDAIGVASFGPVDVDVGSPTYGRILSTPKEGWSGTDVVGPLREAFGVPIGLDTDVNGAALGERRWGATRSSSTSVYVTVGTGIGGGGLVQGHPLHGLLHPEMGHLMVRRHPDDGHAGSCPFHGDCLEGLAAGPAIEDRWGRPAAELGDLTARAVELEAFYLAQLVTAVTYVLSPHRIVLGGGVMHLPGLLSTTRRRAVELFADYLQVDVVRHRIEDFLVQPQLGDRSGVLGAIALAQDAAAET